MNISKNYYENIDVENERLLKYISTSENKINDLSSFLSDIYSNCLNICKSTSKKLSSFFDDSKISNITTKTDQNITFFYQTSNIFLEKFSDIMEKFNHIIITPLNNFKINYTKENNDIKNDFLLLLKDYKNEKKKLIAYQKKYYNSTINYVNLKNNYHNLKNNKNKEAQCEKCWKDMEEKRWMMKNNRLLYKYQVGAVNIYYKNYDLRYKRYYKSFEKNERNKLIFLYNTFRIFSLKIKELTESLNDLSRQINIKFNGWKIEEDNNIIKDEFNYIGRYINSENIYNDSNTIQRFNKEVFMPYNMVNMNYINNFYSKNFNSKNSRSNDNILNINNNKREDSGKNFALLDNIKNKEYQNKIINEFYGYFNGNEEITYNIISKIIEISLHDIEFCYRFIKYYYSENKNKYIHINKDKNVKHFCIILLNILINIRDKKNEIDNDIKNKIIIKILKIGQLIYYVSINKNKKQNIFLSGLLNKYIEFRHNNYWENLLYFRIKKKLRKIYDSIEKDKSKINEKKYKLNILIDKNDMFLSILNINNNKDKLSNEEKSSNNETNDEENKDKLNDKSSKISNSIKSKKMEKNEIILEDEIKDIYLQNAFHKFHLILLEFIQFLDNYNFGLNNSKLLINKICQEFKINKDLKNYYISYLNSFSYSIKQYSHYLNHKMNKKIEEFKVNNIIKSDPQITNKKIKKIVLNEKEKVIIILNISKYLSNNQKIKLIRLSKSIKDKIYKKVYKEILYYSDKEKNRNYKIHVEIWKNFLDYKDIKKKYPYDISKKKIPLKKPLANYEQTDFYIIDLDCQRTLFENSSNLLANYRTMSGTSIKEQINKNKMIDNINNYHQKLIEMKRMSLSNILKTLITLNPEPTYCQGMNFIGVFLLKMLNEREDDAFYLMMGLFKCTTYPQIFHDNLYKLTLYFKIFDRILLIFIPTLYNYFKSNNIIPNYYLSSCFITLFTNYANKEKKMTLFIKVFDLFIIEEWKGIFNILLEIMWRNEEKLLSLKNENLLHFLNGNLMNDFLINYNEYNCFELYTKQKISKKLIINIENQLMNSKKLGISFD